MFDLQGLNFRYFVKKHEYTQATRYYLKLGESFTEMKTKIPKILKLDGKKHNKHSQNWGSERMKGV